MPRARTTKARAQRIDLNYFKRPIPMRRTRFWLCLVLPVVSLLWIGWKLAGRDWRPYSSGQLSSGHVLLTQDCETCHAPSKSAYREHADEKACFACHDGPAHRTNQVAAEVPECGACHMEHRGQVRLASTPDASCSRCHADLKTTGGPATVARSISSLQTDHPEMAFIREKRRDPGTIRVNHSAHMKANLLGPKGAVQLACADCHKQLVAATKADWKYGSAQVSAAAPVAPVSAAAPVPAAMKSDLYAPDPAHALMSMPKFAESCAACHLLQFDPRIADQVPHDKPDVVHAFVVKKFEAYVAAHPEELREGGGAPRRLPTQPPPAAAHVVTASQWVAERTQEAEKLLWGKTCRQCHLMMTPAEAPALPKVEPAHYTQLWLPKARFDHDAHRGFSCESCHPGGRTSKDTADILVPAIATCKTCHAPGPAHVESRCFECHAYHDWSKRKEIHPTFVPRPLKAAAQQRSSPAGQ